MALPGRNRVHALDTKAKSMVTSRGAIRAIDDTGGDAAPATQKWKKARKVGDATLSVLLVTYNHEKYIHKALQSISMQVLQGIPTEIVVADDGSTDATRQLIEDYFVANPMGPVRFLDFKRNRGVTRNYQRSWACLTTKYVAVLEGDDYWTDPEKLSKQVAFLEDNSACVGCSANYLVGFEATAQFLPRIPQEPSKVSYLDARSLINDNLIGNFSTCVYRTEALTSIPPAVYDTKSYDWIMNIALARWGPIAFFHDIMSVYRVHSSGTWSGMSQRQKLQTQIDQIKEYDQLTSGIFTEQWDELVSKLRAEVDRLATLEAATGVPDRADGPTLTPESLMGEGGPMLTPESLMGNVGVVGVQSKRSMLGRLVRTVHASMPEPMLNTARAMSPNALRNLIKTIGKT